MIFRNKQCLFCLGNYSLWLLQKCNNFFFVCLYQRWPASFHRELFSSIRKNVYFFLYDNLCTRPDKTLTSSELDFGMTLTHKKIILDSLDSSHVEWLFKGK